MNDSYLDYSLAEDTLYQAAKNLDLKTVKELASNGVINPEAFLGTASDIQSIDNGHVEDNLFNLYETLLLAGHPLPVGYMRSSVVGLICRQKKDKWGRSNLLLKDIFGNPEYAFSEQLASFIIAGNNLSTTGNLEGLKLLLEEHASEEKLKELYEKNKTQSFPYFLFEGINDFEEIQFTQDKLECFDYFLDLFPETFWRTLGIHSTSPNHSFITKAAEIGDETLLRWLVEKGHSINDPLAPYISKKNLKTDDVTNPISRALNNQHFDIIPTLLELGCSTKQPEYDLYGPLQMAIKNCGTHLLPLLINNGADVNQDINYPEEPEEKPTQNKKKLSTTRFDESPLLTAVLYQDIEAVEILISAGADLEYTDTLKRTPLIYAALLDNLEIFQALCNAGASKLAECEIEGTTKTPIIIAYEKNSNVKSWLEAMAENQRMETNTNQVKTKRKHSHRL